MGPRIGLSIEAFGETQILTFKSSTSFEESKQCSYIVLVPYGHYSLKAHFLVLFEACPIIYGGDETGLTLMPAVLWYCCLPCLLQCSLHVMPEKIIILWNFLPPMSTHTMNLIKIPFIYYAENKELTISTKMTITFTSNGFQYLTKMIQRKP